MGINPKTLMPKILSLYWQTKEPMIKIYNTDYSIIDIIS